MNQEELRQHPIFVCGHPKSGTSLLRAVFDSHPQLVVYPEETVFFRRFLPRAENKNRDALLELADQTLIHIFQWRRDNPHPSQAGFPDRDYSSIPYEQVRSELRRLVDKRWINLGDMLSAAVLAYGCAGGLIGEETRAWVEKSPYNEYYTDLIYSWWPQARCVHIVRDPRDNFSSYRLKHSDWTPEFFAAGWRRSTQAGFENLSLYGESRYMILRYEELAQSPETTLRRLTRFLNIDWNASLAAPTRAGAEWQGNSMFSDRFGGISAAPVARWKENLPTQDSAVIEAMTGALMQRLAYPRGERPMLSRMAARVRALTWPLRRRIALRNSQKGNHA